MDYTQLSGLEIVRGIIEGKFPKSRMAEIVPVKFTEAEDGVIRGTAMASEQHVNPSGSVHGGFAATVIDTFTALAIMTKLGPGESHTTIDLNVKMLKPVPVNQTLSCIGEVINISRRLAVSDATIKDEKGKVVAYGNATCMVFR